MLELTLRDDDIAAIDALVDELADRYDTVESAEFHRESRNYAEELPRGLRRAINDFRLAETSGVFVLSGLPVNDVTVGPTPRHWKNRSAGSSTLRHDLAFFLVASLLGDPIAWATQQDGRIMHDIFPIKEHQHEQIGWGSDELLTWHTEDAYHPLRTDYLGLMCLRNPDNVETTVADMSSVRLDEKTRKILSEEQFVILPDNSHRTQNQIEQVDGDPAVDELRARSRDQVQRALNAPEPVAVLFGSPERPYVRIDPYFMQYDQDEEGQRALDTIGSAIDGALGGAVLRPGDICFIDNYRVVHGRKPFKARFDETDRWLRRLNVARDLRKSREFRLHAESRVIY